jgi:hypothetical protein
MQLSINDFWALLEKNNVSHRLIITYSDLKCTLADMNELIVAFEDPNIRYAVWINIGTNEVSEKIRAPIDIELFGDNKVVYESLCYSMESVYTTQGGTKRYANQKWQVSSKLGQVFDNFAAKSQLGYDLLKKYAKKDLKFGNSTFTEDGIYANDNVILEIIDRSGSDAYGRNDDPKIISYKDGSTILHCGIAIFRDADNFEKEDFQCTLGHEMFIHFDIKADNLIGLWRDRNKSTAHFNKFEQYLSKNNSKNGNVDHCGYTNSEAKYGNFNKHINEIKKSKIYDDKLFESAKKNHDIRTESNCKANQ